ncbi:Cysteine--tRNA ligase [Candidatus Anstonella stagnisolia]|nr:Cysteine--tRNA ligase [Candidatus Anstonella stagnisolia]
MVKVYNTMGKKVEELKVPKGKKLGVYVCGLTTYDYSHMGHARTYVAFDIVIRYLKKAGFEVKFVQNVTDIDDKILKRAMERGEEPLALSARFDRLAREDMKALNIMPADVYPKASENLGQIAKMVRELEEKGFAYKTKSGIYFEVGKFREYGKLSGQKLGELNAGARVAVDESKKNPEDFALWKFTKVGEWGFESGLGKGRPGWHIECSAMAREHLGETVDIHGGARDLVFPHHENEIAQSEAANGKKFVKHWMHTGFLTVNGEKMAKSLGNFVTIRDALSKFDANSIRMFFAMAHYRSPVDYSEKSIETARNTLEKIFGNIARAKGAVGGKSGSIVGDAQKAAAEFDAAMENDFDTPNAAATMIALSKKLGEAAAEGKAKEVGEALGVLYGMLDVFGIDYSNVRTHHMLELGESAGKESDAGAEGMPGVKSIEEKLAKIQGGISDSDIQWLLKARNAARAKKDFALSDRIRKELAAAGIEVEDAKGGASWKRKS